jgi:hypothetical protein
MSKKHRPSAKKKSSHVKTSPAIVAEMAPLPQRYRNWAYDGAWLGHGIQKIDTEISQGGAVVTASAYINTMEAPALTGLFRAGVLSDPRNDEARHRRLMAGLAVRRIFQDSGMEAKSTGHYDKPLNMMLGGCQHPKSNHADDNEVEFIRLMRLCFPYNTVVRNVCCMDERPPTVVRYGLETPCSWKTALCAGLDRIADDIEGRTRQPRRRRFQARPVLRREMENAS